MFASENVELNPILGGSTKYEVGIFDKSRGEIPVSNADAKLTVMRGSEVVYETKLEPIEGKLGYYTATLNWNSIPGFVPGEHYAIGVNVTTLRVNNVQVPSYNYEVVSPPKTILVDYIGGSSNIPGVGRVPSLIVYPSLILILVIGSILAYRVISYMMLPQEVRDIDKLIKLVEKEVYEYETETRDDTIRKMITSELGLE
ncbi:MAG: hypothetical protein ACP6IP_06615 [Candidatus Njordarchaeia archaeon]